MDRWCRAGDRLSVPGSVTDHPGDAYRAATKVLAATEPLLAAVKARQEEEIEHSHPHGDVPRAVQDRQARELSRASDALYVTGLELLASFYRDTAASQMGADVQNTDVPVALLTRMDAKTAVAMAERIFDAIDALQGGREVR